MIDESFRDVIAKHAQGQQELKREVERLPYETSSFPVEALNKIILIRKDLQKATANLPIEPALSSAIGYLDSHQWASRFTSGDIGKRNPESDSLYWVTPEGASLRLKISNKTTGDINAVIQPFYERVIFQDHQNNVLFKPQVGLVAMEYASPEFFAIQKSEKAEAPLKSRIKIYQKDGRPYVLENVENGHSHTSSEINFLR